MSLAVVSFILVLFIGSSFILISPVYGLHYFGGIIETKTNDSDDTTNDGHFSRPTFGLDHENSKKVVDYGFKLNNQKFFISNNFHTSFVEQTINIGERNTFEATVYSEKGLRVQEFLFGIPEVGEAHNAEVGIEVWYNYDGTIQEVVAVQQTDGIDEKHILATHEKIKCKSSDAEERCDSTRISVMFLEPLQDKIMAIKAIDFKNRYQITYLNEGINISGESLNPMNTEIIPSPTKNEGPIKVTQTKKYSVLWASDDGRIFERNSFGSFRQIIDSFERFPDLGEPRNRNHSEFGKLIKLEENRAYYWFNATDLEANLPDTFAYSFPETSQRVTDEVKIEMLEQEKLAKKLIEEFSIQQRFSNINS